MADSDFEKAVECHRRGDLSAAERLYLDLIDQEPDHAAAIHLLGVVAFQTGRHRRAIELIDRAVALEPENAAFRINLGSAYRAAGDLDAAVDSFRRALEINAGDPTAHGNLGNALLAQGKMHGAIASYHRSLELNKNQPEVHLSLARALKETGDFEAAAASCQRAAELRPDYVEAHNNLANILREQGRIDEAVASFERAIAGKPRCADPHLNLGRLLQGQGQSGRAEQIYRAGLEIEPARADLHARLGLVLLKSRRLAAAISSFEKAIELDPLQALAHNGLGIALKEQGEFVRAIAAFQRAAESPSGFTSGLVHGVHLRQQICQWDGLRRDTERIKEAVDRGERVPPFALCSFDATAEQQLACAQRWSADFERAQQAFVFSEKPEKRLIVGYLSCDFREHAVANLAAQLFEEHDRRRIHSIAYAFGPPNQSEMRSRLERAFDKFVDIDRIPNAEAAKQIHNDRVDILVDLVGYTGDPRTEILALRPAPIQVNFLGFPGTMGADFIDYIVVDDYLVPQDLEAAYSEKLVYMPRCYQVNGRSRSTDGQRLSRTEVGLPDDKFVFCCFNQPYKITPEVFEIWMRLLHQLPCSVMWLAESNRLATDNLRREAEQGGISGDRLIFAPKCPKREDHLARIGLADLFLDTWPFNAHATASDALWAGCPLLTRSGRTFASRVAGSLLRALGLTKLITQTASDYERRALSLAREPATLAKIRRRLIEEGGSSALFDGACYARNLETAFDRMWRIRAEGNPPRSFSVS